jgi:hypothetical protein
LTPSPTASPSRGGPGGEREGEIVIVKIIDWDTPANNDFLVASQLWITGPVYKKRTDLVGFVNGLPLVFIELKAAHRHLTNAYHNNLRDYKNTIPHLFWYNVFIILSNGSRSVMGSLTAEWEHFADWKKIASEQEQGVISLETMLRRCLPARRLVDFTENFVLFTEPKAAAETHRQESSIPSGVNRAIEAVKTVIDPIKANWASSGTRRAAEELQHWSSSRRRSSQSARQLDVPRRHRSRRSRSADSTRISRGRVVTEPEEACASSSEHSGNSSARRSSLRLHADPEIPHHRTCMHPVPLNYPIATTSS